MSRLQNPGWPDYVDESVPVHPEMPGGYPVVVFGDHRLCAGHSTRVQKMPGPHMHSQIEFNLVSKGRMTYWFDGHQVTLGEGQMGVFWGMIPHQVTDCAENTEFIVLYVPMSAFLQFSDLDGLRQKIFSGGFLEGNGFKAHDFGSFALWRDDLISGDEMLEPLVRDELTARLRRMDRDGWRDLRGQWPLGAMAFHHDHDQERARKVEEMSRFIGENALELIDVADVARRVNLHPNYAMALFKRTMGLTIKQAVTRHRLDSARSMLIATDAPVSRIAFDCGFGSISSFYEAFEKRFRKSPAAFRKIAVTRQ
ncbi:MAG: helix-turn-helix domain-containing protein [Alphaproteobacteria bacterium]|nr:helix-turn-helix domain-containing protein [Alphaproteobacteria bacterium]